eukprot:jgi/Bigna1/67741/fgenesh1_pg.4_\
MAVLHLATTLTILLTFLGKIPAEDRVEIFRRRGCHFGNLHASTRRRVSTRRYYHFKGVRGMRGGMEELPDLGGGEDDYSSCCSSSGGGAGTDCSMRGAADIGCDVDIQKSSSFPITKHHLHQQPLHSGNMIDLTSKEEGAEQSDDRHGGDGPLWEHRFSRVSDDIQRFRDEGNATALDDALYRRDLLLAMMASSSSSKQQQHPEGEEENLLPPHHHHYKSSTAFSSSSVPGWAVGSNPKEAIWSAQKSVQEYRKLYTYTYPGGMLRLHTGLYQWQNPFNYYNEETGDLVEKLCYYDPESRRFFRERVVANASYLQMQAKMYKKSLKESLKETFREERQEMIDEQGVFMKTLPNIIQQELTRATKPENASQFFSIPSIAPSDAIFNPKRGPRGGWFQVDLGSKKKATVVAVGYHKEIDFRRYSNGDTPRYETSSFIDTNLENRRFCEYKLSETLYIAAKKVKGRWGVDLRRFKFKKDVTERGPMRWATPQGITLNNFNWAKLFVKLKDLKEAVKEVGYAKFGPELHSQQHE